MPGPHRTFPHEISADAGSKGIGGAIKPLRMRDRDRTEGQNSRAEKNKKNIGQKRSGLDDPLAHDAAALKTALAELPRAKSIHQIVPELVEQPAKVVTL
jgi:hypothetical protein